MFVYAFSLSLKYSDTEFGTLFNKIPKEQKYQKSPTLEKKIKCFYALSYVDEFTGFSYYLYYLHYSRSDSYESHFSKDAKSY